MAAENEKNKPEFIKYFWNRFCALVREVGWSTTGVIFLLNNNLAVFFLKKKK